MKYFDKFRAFQAKTDGGFSIFGLYITMVIVIVGGLAVDYAHGVRAAAHLRATVDAAAIAAAYDLPDTEAALATALNNANANAPSAVFGDVVTASDIEFGNWTSADRTFTAGGAPLNAVKVRANMTESNGNPLQLLITSIFGRDTFDVRVEAVAIGESSDCNNYGLFTEQTVYGGSGNTYVDSVCLYGKQGVQIGSDNVFLDDSVVMMPDTGTLVQGTNNAGLDDVLDEKSLQLPLLEVVQTVVGSLVLGDMTYVPSWVTNGPVYLTDIKPRTVLDRNTFYIVDQANLGENRNLKEIMIVSRGGITAGRNVVMQDVFLAAQGKVLLGDRTRLGSSDYCSTGRYMQTIFALGDLEIGSRSEIRSTQAATLGYFRMGPDIKKIRASHIEALLDIVYTTADTFDGCPSSLASDFFEDMGFSHFALVQ